MKRPPYMKEILAWAYDRNLIKGATAKSQFVKLVEELGELELDAKDAIGDATVVAYIMAEQLGLTIQELLEMERTYAIRPEDAIKLLGALAGRLARDKDASIQLADVFALIREISDKEASIRGLPVEEYTAFYESCIKIAYNEIKDRKGAMVDGVFVKEEDL